MMVVGFVLKWGYEEEEEDRGCVTDSYLTCCFVRLYTSIYLIRNKSDTLENFKVFVIEIEINSRRESSDFVVIEAHKHNFQNSMSFINDTELFIIQLHLSLLI